ncbi:aminoglycoside phosphotransferase family protein [Mycobacterium sp. IS-1264]|uniref:phosphotransferase family protein n=1 Tax=Mycobacterium sp. IS-1264 TaxID=1834158 RepID=UPI00096C61EA|nr:aminoglycoside phosphotransferase family protein [Mycobacterium sp. IS-1264]OMC41105.1 hypothetical protein A5744_19380 [Mycobacterium sp. IS-1264]
MLQLKPSFPVKIQNYAFIMNPLERAVAGFVTRQLSCQPDRVIRVDSFATNVVYEVDAGGRRFVVKASTSHDALAAEAWACARGAEAGCGAPEILALGRLGGKDSMSALAMSRIPGEPIAPGHPAIVEVGAALRRLHDTRSPGFGWLAEATWNESGGFSPPHTSWPGFLQNICGEVRRMAGTDSIADTVADEAAAALGAHAGALAAVEVGALCHGDLKASHILVDADRLSGVIDWGDAVVADPRWDIARFTHRADTASVSLLLEGYRPDRAASDELAWCIPLYAALWMLVDASVAHNLGRPAEAPLAEAMAHLQRLPG